jgi:hypothetical protein
MGFPAYSLQFCKLALKSEERTEIRTHICRILFERSLELGDYPTAQQAISSLLSLDIDIHVYVSSYLRQLCNENPLQTQHFSPTTTTTTPSQHTLNQIYEETLISLAEQSGITKENTNYYSALYVFYLSRHLYQKAAITMYRLGCRISASGDLTIQSLTRQVPLFYLRFIYLFSFILSFL